MRSTELRDPRRRAGRRTRCGSSATPRSAPVRIIANRPGRRDAARSTRTRCARRANRITCPRTSRCCSSRSGRATCRTSAGTLEVTGVEVGGHQRAARDSPAIPNAIAALLLYIRDRHGQDPARLLRLDRRQPDRLPAEVPGVRRGRHRAGHPRSAAPDRVEPSSPSSDPRRVTAASSTPCPLTAVTSISSRS